MNSPNVKRSATALLGAALLLLAAGCPKPQPVHTKLDDPAAGPQRRDDVKDLALGETLEVPYILWGGDVATFLANGGETTRPGTPFAEQGLKVKLVRGDDFAAQVKN